MAATLIPGSNYREQYITFLFRSPFVTDLSILKVSLRI